MAIPGIAKIFVGHTLIDMRESRETHTPASIGLLLDQLKDLVSSVESSKMTLELAKVPSVECQRATSRVRGTSELQGFADALRDACRAVAMKALQKPLSDLSDAPRNGAIHSDSSTQKETKNKAADKGKPSRKAKQE